MPFRGSKQGKTRGNPNRRGDLFQSITKVCRQSTHWRQKRWGHRQPDVRRYVRNGTHHETQLTYVLKRTKDDGVKGRGKCRTITEDCRSLAKRSVHLEKNKDKPSSSGPKERCTTQGRWGAIKQSSVMLGQSTQTTQRKRKILKHKSVWDSLEGMFERKGFGPAAQECEHENLLPRGGGVITTKGRLGGLLFK